MPLRLATRSSPLALWQADHVAAGLAELGVDAELVLTSTSADRRLDVPISEMGGIGVFVSEVQHAVLDGRADAAVHSAKDLPSSFGTDGLVLAAVPRRGDPRDALVGTPLADLDEGATIATGSARRRAQLAHVRPDLRFVELRGNLARRVARADDDDVDAVPVALVALERLGMDVALDVLDPALCLPQVGQGALAIECRADDDATRAALAGLEHADDRRCVDAERSFLAHLGGGCDLPVGAWATIETDGRLTVRGVLAAPDGSQVLRARRSGTTPDVGAAVAAELLDAGGTTLLSSQAS